MSVRASRGERGRGAGALGGGGGGRVMPRDEQQFLGVLARWRCLTAAQVAGWLDLSELIVYRRLRVLRGHGLVEYARPFAHEPGVFLITTAGLGVLRSELPAPRLDLRTHRHDLLAVSAAVALRDERPDLVVVSEREMRSLDRREDRDPDAPLLGVAYPGFGPSGFPRLHYPDLALADRDGRRRVAVEVELTSKGRRRLEQILTAYARDRYLDRVVYLTDRDAIARAVTRAAEHVGAGALLDLRRLDPSAAAAPTPPIERTVR